MSDRISELDRHATKCLDEMAKAVCTSNGGGYCQWPECHCSKLFHNKHVITAKAVVAALAKVMGEKEIP